MNSKRVWEVALTVLVAIFLLVAAEGRHPYGLYMVLRTAATVGGIYWAVRVYQAGPRGWRWAFRAVALLLSPVLPVRMHREHWQPIDMLLGVLLFGWAGYWFDSADGAVPAAITEKLPGRVNKKAFRQLRDFSVHPRSAPSDKFFSAFRRTLSALAEAGQPHSRAQPRITCAPPIPPQAQMSATESPRAILSLPECAQFALKWRRRPKS